MDTDRDGREGPHCRGRASAACPARLKGSIMNQIVACPEPECDVAAEVVSRWVWPSTDGPVEHVKVFCLHGHARTLLTAWLVTPARSAKVVYPSTRWN
jgi:hypothetical protein